MEYLDGRKKRRLEKCKTLLFCNPNPDVLIEILLYVYPHAGYKMRLTNKSFYKAFKLCIKMYPSHWFTDQQLVNMSDSLLEESYFFSKCTNHKLRLIWIRASEDRWPFFMETEYKNFIKELCAFKSDELKLIKHTWLKRKKTRKIKNIKGFSKCKDKKEYIIIFFLMKIIRQDRLLEIGRSIYLNYLIHIIEHKREAKYDCPMYTLKKMFEYFKGRAISGAEAFAMTFKPLNLKYDIDGFIEWLTKQKLHKKIGIVNMLRILQWSNHIK